MPTVNNSRTGDVIVEGVHLKPGSNDISDKQAETLRSSPAYKRHARRGWLGGLDLDTPAAAAVNVTVQTPERPAIAGPAATPSAEPTPPEPQKPDEPPPDHPDMVERSRGRAPSSKR